MKDGTLLIELDELIPYLSPSHEPLCRPRDFSAVGDAEERFRDVSLSLVLRRGNDEIRIRGSAFALSKDGEDYIIEEPVELIRESDFPRYREELLLRGQLLALALSNTKKLSRVLLRFVIVSEGNVKTQTIPLEKECLSAILSTHAPKIFSLAPLWKKGEGSIVFPYSALRQGQRELIQAAWDAIRSSTKLYACAPTGIGKTLAVLYPALKALEKGKVPQVFYASPKNTLKLQAATAVEALQKEKGLRTLVLSSKTSLCPEKREDCEKQMCEYALGFWEKLPEALSFLSSFSLITEKELSAAASYFHICPFDLALQLQKHCQVVIGDYNHVFDPIRAVFAPKPGSILLVDEAHNLPNRIRESFTQALSPADFDPFFRDSTPPAVMLREHFSDVLGEFTRLRKAREDAREFFSPECPEKLSSLVSALIPKVTFALREGFGTLTEETARSIKELYQKLTAFARLSKLFNEEFSTLFPPEGGSKIYLVDPREKILEGCSRWRSVLFFSATLLPQAYYFDLLGGQEEDRFLTLPSPFPRENLFVGLCQIDVSFSQRFATAPKICGIIRAAVSVKPGNYMVFLPSFEYLRLVSQAYKERFFDHKILVQEKVMSAKARRDFLEEFRTNRKGTLIGFCVMGGVFSEGIDLKGESLLGEIIVGTGFPPPSPEGEAECASYYKREMDGKSFAYTLPGWSRVLQAAGRVIRSEEDRGFLILCDARYLGEDMQNLFPESWEGFEILEREAQLREKLTQFWK